MSDGKNPRRARPEMTPTERGQTFLGIWLVVMLVSLSGPSLAGTPTEAQIMGDGTWMRFGLTDLSRARVDALMARVRGVHGVVGIELPAISRLVKKDGANVDGLARLPESVAFPNLRTLDAHLAKRIGSKDLLDLGALRLTDAAATALGEVEEARAGLPESPTGLRVLLQNTSALTLRLTTWPAEAFLAVLRDVGEGDVVLQGVAVTPERLKQLWGGRRTSLGLKIGAKPALVAVLGLDLAYLQLELPARLPAEWATLLAKWKGVDLQLDGVTSLDVESARALAKFGGDRLGLPSVRYLEPKVAEALGAWPGHHLELPGYRVTSKLRRGVRAIILGKSRSAAQGCVPSRVCPPKGVSTSPPTLPFNTGCTLDPPRAPATQWSDLAKDAQRCLEHTGRTQHWRRQIGSAHGDSTETFVKMSVDRQFAVIVSTAMLQVEPLSWMGTEVVVIHVASGATISRRLMESTDTKPGKPFARYGPLLALETVAEDGKLFIIPPPEGGVRNIHLRHQDLVASEDGLFTLTSKDAPALWRVRLPNFALLHQWEAPAQMGTVAYLLPGADLVLAHTPCDPTRGRDCERLTLWSASQNQQVACARAAGWLSVEMTRARDALTWTSLSGKKVTIDPGQLAAWPGCESKPGQK